MWFQTSRLIKVFSGLLTGMLMCTVVAAQGVNARVTPTPTPTDPNPIFDTTRVLTGITFSSPFINIGGSPQNIFVTPVPATASLANCVISSPTTALATYNPAYILGPTITVLPTATGVTQAVEHTFTCGAVSKTFVVKPSTYPAEIVLSGTALQAGSATAQSLTVTASPAGTVLPTCTITSTPALATVTVDATLATKIALIPSAEAITADTTQTVTCGSLSKTFTVKAKDIANLSIVADGPITDQSIVASVTVAPSDKGKRGFVFVLLVWNFNPVMLLGNADGSLAGFSLPAFELTPADLQLDGIPKGTINPFALGNFPAFYEGVLNSHTLTLSRGDKSPFKGNLLAIGYGVGADRKTAFQNMMANANVCYCHTFK